MTEVVIIGAGPAGAAAAIELADAGRHVTVIDKARFPRDKCCGDGLTAGALRWLDHLGVEPVGIDSWKTVHDVWLHRPSGAAMQFPLPHGPGWFAATAMRRELDAAIVDRAREAGAEVLEGTELDDLELRDGRVTAWTSDGPIAADWCIAADGMWSKTRKTLGLDRSTGRYLGEWHAFRQYWQHVAPAAAEELHVWFEPDVLPGYIWSFPLSDGRANIGFGILRGSRPTREMAALWRDITERPHIRAVIGEDATPIEDHTAWPIPARVGELPLTAHRVLFVGDAAASCDPMTGEGIGQALQTGVAAARSIIETADPDRVPINYERAVDQELAVDMRFAASLGGVLGTSLGAEWSLRTAGMTRWTSRNFARWLFEDYPRALLGTPRRWSADMFSRPGAYERASG